MTDHVNDQLCQRIEELEKEKLELNEQLDIAQQQCDALSAHAERVREASVGLRNLMTVAGSSAEHYLYKMFDALEERPETSLTRLKALWMAEGAQRAADSIRYDYDGHIHQDRIAEYVDDVALELRRQAEGGE